MKLKRAIAACSVVSLLLLAGVLFEYFFMPRNAISAAAVIRRSWPAGEQSSRDRPDQVSALLDAADTDKPGLLDAAAQAGSSCLEIRHQLQLQQHAFCL